MTVLTAERPALSLSRVDHSGRVRYARRLELTINPWKMRVWLNNGSVVNPAGAIPFNTVTYDTVNGFNTSTSIYTVALTGWYQINVVLNPQTPAAAQNWALQVVVTTVVAGNAYLIEGPISSATSGGLGTTMGAGLNDVYYFNAGDQVYILALFSIAPLGVGAQGGNWNFGNVQTYGEYWSMSLISG